MNNIISMKLFMLLVLLGYCLGRPQTPNFTGNENSLIGLVRSESEGPNADGSYKFDFESEDGIARNEEGALKDPETLSVSGGYSYTAPDGTYVVVTYVADENGFRPNVVIQEAAPPSFQTRLGSPRKFDQGK